MGEHDILKNLENANVTLVNGMLGNDMLWNERAGVKLFTLSYSYPHVQIKTLFFLEFKDYCCRILLCNTESQLFYRKQNPAFVGE